MYHASTQEQLAVLVECEQTGLWNPGGWRKKIRRVNLTDQTTKRPDIHLILLSQWTAMMCEVVWYDVNSATSYCVVRWAQSDSNAQPSDLESDALPLRHRPWELRIRHIATPAKPWAFKTTTSPTLTMNLSYEDEPESLAGARWSVPTHCCISKLEWLSGRFFRALHSAKKTADCFLFAAVAVSVKYLSLIPPVSSYFLNSQSSTAQMYSIRIAQQEIHFLRRGSHSTRKMGRVSSEAFQLWSTRRRLHIQLQSQNSSTQHFNAFFGGSTQVWRSQKWFKRQALPLSGRGGMPCHSSV